MFCQHVCLCTVCMFDAYRDQKKALGSLNLKLGMVVSWRGCQKMRPGPVCFCVWICACRQVWCLPQPEASILLELVLKAVVNCPMWVVGLELWKTMHSSLNSWAIFPTHHSHYHHCHYYLNRLFQGWNSLLPKVNLVLLPPGCSEILGCVTTPKF